MTYTQAQAHAALEQLKVDFVTAMQAGDATLGAQLAESAAQLAAWIEQGMPGEPPREAAALLSEGTLLAPGDPLAPLAEDARHASDQRLAVLTLRLLASPELPAALRELALEAASVAAGDTPLRNVPQAIQQAQDLAGSGQASDIEPAMSRLMEALSACEALDDAELTGALRGDLRRMLNACENVHRQAGRTRAEQLRREASDLLKSGLIAGYEQALEKLKQSGNLAVEIGDERLCLEVESEYRACHATMESVRQLWVAAQVALGAGRWEEATTALAQLRDEHALTGDHAMHEVERGLVRATCEQARSEMIRLSEEWSQRPSGQVLQELNSWLARLRTQQPDMDGEQQEMLSRFEVYVAGLKVPPQTEPSQLTQRQQKDRELHRRVSNLKKQADYLMESGLVKDIQPALDKMKEAAKVSKGLGDEVYTRDLQDNFQHYSAIQRQVSNFLRNLEDLRATQQWKPAARLLRLGITATGNGGRSWVLSGWETPDDIKTEADFLEHLAEFQLRYGQLAAASYKQPLLNSMGQTLEQMRPLRDRLRPANRKLLDKLEQFYSQSRNEIWKKGERESKSK